MTQVSMTVRMDSQLKSMFDKLCEEFGMSANTAMNVFAKAVVQRRRIPFEIKAGEQVVISSDDKVKGDFEWKNSKKVWSKNKEDNKKYFYQLDGEGIRYELVAFAKSIELNKNKITLFDSYYDIVNDKGKILICYIIQEIKKVLDFNM